MKKIFLTAGVLTTLTFFSCKNGETKTDAATTSTTTTEATTHSQSGVVDETSQPNVVQVVVKSPDHTTLVKAVQTADLVNALSNAGPFTVFAPTNAAFDKLPAGTVEGLLKEDKRADLTKILQYHVYVGVLKDALMQDGMSYNMVDGGNIKISMVDGKPVINGKAHVVATVPAANGIVYVIDEVLTPEK